jgi:hypothetical protein
VLYAEQTLVKTLPKLQAEAADDELAEVSESISRRPGST